MGNLNSHYDASYVPGQGGGSYLPAGKHKVRVVSFEVVTSSKKGTPGVKFQFESVDGLEAHETFWLTPKAYVRLASFAKACGLTENDLEQYDPDTPNGHAILVHRWVVVDWQLQTDSDKYHEVVNWEMADNGPAVAMPTAAEANAVPSGDDIPF